MGKEFFDLNGNTIETRKKTSVIYDFSFNDLSDFTLSSGWNIYDGVLKNTLYGISNRLLLGKSFTLDPRIFICDFKVVENTEIFFGTQRDFNYFGDVKNMD